MVYPNPSDGSIKVQTTLANGQILILDLFGRKVYEQSISHGQTTIDLPPGLKGVFLMECHYSGGKVVKPIVLR